MRSMTTDWWTGKGGVLSSDHVGLRVFKKVVFWLSALLPLTLWCQCESIFLNASCEFAASNHQKRGQRTLQVAEGWILYRKLSGWSLCSNLNMIFVFHDNGDGDDDNAVCIVMLMWVPAVTGRRYTGVHHAGFEPSFALQRLTDWWIVSVWRKDCVPLSLCPPTCTFLSISFWLSSSLMCL